MRREEKGESALGESDLALGLSEEFEQKHRLQHAVYFINRIDRELESLLLENGKVLSVLRLYPPSFSGTQGKQSPFHCSVYTFVRDYSVKF